MAALRKTLEPAFIAVLQQAAENIRAFHRRQVRNSFVITGDGIVTGQKITPIAKVGLYVPGGTAAYPSYGADGLPFLPKLQVAKRSASRPRLCRTAASIR